MTERAKLSPAFGPLYVVLASLLAVAACQPAGFSAPADPRVTPRYGYTGLLERLDYDSDGNGVPDVRTYMNAGRPVRSEIDANEDGVVDRWEYFDERQQVQKVGTASAGDGREDTWVYPPSDGASARIERSSRRDGVVDRREFLEGDETVRAEADTDGDGRLDRWETYEDGVLVALALDTSRADGRPDRRLVYGADGTLLRIDSDPDGDGTFEALPLKSGAVEPR